MTGSKTMSRQAFVGQLEEMRAEMLRTVRSGRYGRLSFGDRRIPPSERPEVATILKLVLYPEQRVADVLANRFSDIPDLDIRERVANQMFEEISHAQLIRRMLAQWGHDPDEPYSHPVKELVEIFDYIESLETMAEYFSTFIIGEGLFLSTYLEDMQENDPHAFSPYLEAALADEPGHIQLARDAVERYATTGELQERTRRSAKHILNLFLGGYQARVRQLQAELDRAGTAQVSS